MNNNFGIIIHWGIYAQPAFDNVVSGRKRKIQNGSEWYYKRLTDNNTYRPTSGNKETQEYHNKHYNNKNYYDFSISENVDVKKWIELAKEIGASYIILTAKHHDGYCLWPSKYAEHHTTRNIVKDFCDEAKKAGLLYGLYFSWFEFTKSVTKEFITNIIVPQIRELAINNPNIWWFDGHWEIKTEYAKKTIMKLCKIIKNNNVLINDRIPDTDYASYRVYEDRYIPIKKSIEQWEHINTIGLSWGYNKQQEKSDYKNGKDLYQVYQKVREFGGRFLLNIGPDEYGNIDTNELNSLKELKVFLQNDEKL